jgi:hypothetical protein
MLIRPLPIIASVMIATAIAAIPEHPALAASVTVADHHELKAARQIVGRWSQACVSFSRGDKQAFGHLCSPGFRLTGRADRLSTRNSLPL